MAFIAMRKFKWFVKILGSFFLAVKWEKKSVYEYMHYLYIASFLLVNYTLGSEIWLSATSTSG